MPIKIPDTLPAFETLVHEGVRVMTETAAIRQDIRPLQIGLLNLMPNKIKTEVQMARLVGASPLQVELSLVRIGDHKAKNTLRRPSARLLRDLGRGQAPQVRRLHHHRRAGRDARLRGRDLLGRDGADPRLDRHQRPFDAEHLLGRDGGDLPFPQGAEIHAEGKGLRRLPSPQPQSVLASISTASPTISQVPVSRWTEVRRADIEKIAGPRNPDGIRRDGRVLRARGRRASGSTCSTTWNMIRRRCRTNISAMSTPACRSRCRTTISPTTTRRSPPQNRWRSHAHLLFGNWINEIYQTTPYKLDEIGTQI